MLRAAISAVGVRHKVTQAFPNRKASVLPAMAGDCPQARHRVTK